MNQRKIGLLGSLFALLHVLVACAEGRVVRVSNPTRPLSTFTSVRIDVSSPLLGAFDEVAGVETMLGARLAEANIFAAIRSGQLDSERPADLILEVKITDLYRVGGQEQVIGGMMSGQARINADVRLLDGRSRREIGSISIVAKSAVGGVVSLFQGNTRHAMQELVTAIMAYIQANL